MKILFFAMHTMRGGAERVISTLCNGKLANNNKIYILTVLNTKVEFEFGNNVEIKGLISEDSYKKRGKIYTLPTVCSRYYRVVKKLEPDVIICFLPEPCFIAGFYRKKLGIPVIGSERGNPYFQFNNFPLKLLGNWLYNKSDCFVFQTRGARDFFIKPIREKAVIIGNPLQKSVLPIVSSKEKDKEIVAVGRFAYGKNYPMLVSAFSKVLKIHPEFKLRIYGKYENDDEAVALIRQYHLEDRILLEGVVENVRDTIHYKYAYVLPSFAEGLPNALMEAMSEGLPVIATDCPSGGPRQLINNEVNGILVENKNEKELTKAMIRLIEDADLCDRLGRAAKDIEEEYAEDIISEQWENLIHSIVGLGKDK